MARKEKPIQLRTVDDSNPEPAPALRLDNRETEWRSREPKPVRLGPAEDAPGVSRRLELPDRDEIELRTHQPGIDVLIEPESTNPDQLEENWGEATIQRQPIAWGWFALLGLVILGAVTWSLTRVEKAAPLAVQIRSETASTLGDEEQEELEASRLIDRMDATVRDFFNATSVDALSRLVRHSARVTPLMRGHYADKPVYAGRLQSIRAFQPLTLDKRGNFWLVSVALSGDQIHRLILEITESGEPRVDWETFVCHQPMKWDDFALRRPTDGSLDFRVYVQEDNFYSHEFADSDQWVSFRLTALQSDETLFGYARVGSAEAAELAGLARGNGNARASVILRLSVPEGIQSRRGVVIETLISPRWIHLDPFDSDS